MSLEATEVYARAFDLNKPNFARHTPKKAGLSAGKTREIPLSIQTDDKPELAGAADRWARLRFKWLRRCSSMPIRSRHEAR